MIFDLVRKLLSFFKTSELEANLFSQQGHRGKAEVEIRQRGNVFAIELEVKHSDLSDGSLCEFFVRDQKLGTLQISGGFGKTRFETQDRNLTSVLDTGAEVAVKVGDSIVYTGTLRYD